VGENPPTDLNAAVNCDRADRGSFQYYKDLAKKKMGETRTLTRCGCCSGTNPDRNRCLKAKSRMETHQSDDALGRVVPRWFLIWRELRRAAFVSSRHDAVANIAIIIAGILTNVLVSAWPDIIAV
jgi:hypothetical protein